MIAHLRGRADALVRSGWTRREAEWLALVCLHSGVFLRSQYLAFIGRTNPALANRFVRRCRKHAVEQPWNGSRLRICRIAARRIYRTLGAEHVRHRRPAAPEVVLRRLLSLDYVLEHPHAAWLPTEDEKVNALTAAGITKDLLPRRLYQGAVGAQYRYFPHKLPVALDGVRATFLFVHAEDELESDAQAPPNRTIDDDWLLRWRDSASKVSAETLQTLWGRVLAGEVRHRESFSLRVLEFLKNLSQEEARRIEKLAPFVIDNSFVFSGNRDALESEGISFSSLVELQDLGVITQARAGLSVSLPIPQNGRGLLSYNRVLIVKPETEKADLDLAIYRLTSLGSQVIRLGSFTAHEAYFRSVGEEIKRKGFKVFLARYTHETDSAVHYVDSEEL